VHNGNGTQLVKIGFQGDEIEAVRDGSDVWVSVRRVCEALGVSLSAQRKKLLADESARVVIIATDDSRGTSRDMLAIELDSLALWLASINAGKVRTELRPKLIAYKREAARVLRDHFFGPRDVVAPSPVAASLPAIAGIVRESPALLGDLRRLVGACARNTNASERQIRGWMVKVSGAASYLRMPLVYGAFVREQLMRVALGEDAPPWRRKALPSRGAGQQVFPPPVGPAQA
jgi:hypothetical protein